MPRQANRSTSPMLGEPAQLADLDELLGRPLVVELPDERTLLAELGELMADQARTFPAELPTLPEPRSSLGAVPDLAELVRDRREPLALARVVVRQHGPQMALDVAIRLLGVFCQRWSRGWRAKHLRHVQLAQAIITVVELADARERRSRQQQEKAR